jgi:hypothetical protein
MKGHQLFIGLVGMFGWLFVVAQAPITQDLMESTEVPVVPDFSGTYISGTPVEAYTYAEPTSYPFTRVGTRAHAIFDPISADPQQQNDCAGESVPSVIWGGNPMAIVQQDGIIFMRFESGDTMRRIYLDDTLPLTVREHTITGFSTGHWEGAELRIETTHLQAGVITNRGHPMSENARLSERYWRNLDSDNLQMELIVQDPINYTEPVTLTREFVWSEEERVQSWNCISLGPRFIEPDIDELARMLEDL